MIFLPLAFGTETLQGVFSDNLSPSAAQRLWFKAVFGLHIQRQVLWSCFSHFQSVCLFKDSRHHPARFITRFRQPGLHYKYSYVSMQTIVDVQLTPVLTNRCQWNVLSLLKVATICSRRGKKGSWVAEQLFKSLKSSKRAVQKSHLWN